VRCQHCGRPRGRGGRAAARCGEAAVPFLTEGRREAVWFCPAHASLPEGAGYRRASSSEEAVLEVMSS
jgi:hypothetical protein